MDKALAILAHELRTPLSAIEYAMARLPDVGTSSDIRATRDVVHRQVRQLSGLVEHALDGGRIATLVDDDDGATLRIRDTGIGIPAEMLERIFEPFTRLSHASAGSAPGLGIGLALVRGIVMLHGGVVTVHSDGAVRGSEFVVRLPIAEVATLGT